MNTFTAVSYAMLLGVSSVYASETNLLNDEANAIVTNEPHTVGNTSASVGVDAGGIRAPSDPARAKTENGVSDVLDNANAASTITPLSKDEMEKTKGGVLCMDVWEGSEVYVYCNPPDDVSWAP